MTWTDVVTVAVASLVAVNGVRTVSDNGAVPADAPWATTALPSPGGGGGARRRRDS